MTKIQELQIISLGSSDPDTQTACLIQTPSGAEVGAANSLTRGVEATVERLSRPAKYTYIMHAERKAIARAACHGIALSGSTMYLNWFPCADCAQSIVEAGIAKLVADRERYESRKNDPRYGFAAAMAILIEGGVEIGWLDELEAA